MRSFVIILAILVAGCAEVPAEPPEEFLEAEATATSGAITGVVVDPLIVPVVGAIVTIPALAINATTDETGKFVFEDLEPGLYPLFARADRFFEVQQTADVQAGKATEIRIVLEPDLTPEPFHETFAFKGRIEFHATVVWAQLEWMLDTYAGISTPACNCVATFEASGEPDGHLYEAVWEDNIADPRGPNENYWSYAVPDPYQELFGYAPSPIRQTWGADAFAEPTGEYKVMMLGDADGVAIQQEFEIFLTHFYHSEVPETFSIVEGNGA